MGAAPRRRRAEAPGPADWFTGTVWLDQLVEAPPPARGARRARGLRARSPYRLAHPPAWADPARPARPRAIQARGWPVRLPARRHGLDPSRRGALARPRPRRRWCKSPSKRRATTAWRRSGCSTSPTPSTPRHRRRTTCARTQPNRAAAGRARGPPAPAPRAAQWRRSAPPRSITLHRRRSVKVRAASERGGRRISRGTP